MDVDRLAVSNPFSSDDQLAIVHAQRKRQLGQVQNWCDGLRMNKSASAVGKSLRKILNDRLRVARVIKEQADAVANLLHHGLDFDTRCGLRESKVLLGRGNGHSPRHRRSHERRG